MLRTLFLGTLWLMPFLSAQVEAPYFQIQEVFEFQDIKYYRLQEKLSSEKMTSFSEEEFGLLSKSRRNEYDLLVPQKTLQQDFASFQAYVNGQTALSFTEPLCGQLHFYLNNPLQIELKTTFALLHLMGQKKSTILFQFQEPIHKLEQKTLTLQKQLVSAILKELLTSLEAFQQSWQELATLIEAIQKEVQKEPALEKFSPVVTHLSEKIQGRGEQLVALFQQEIQLKDLEARLQFLTPYLGREVSSLIAEYKKIQGQQSEMMQAQKERLEFYRKSLKTWNQQFIQGVLSLYQQELQEQINVFNVRYHALVTAQVEQEKLEAELQKMEAYRQKLKTLQQGLQEEASVSSAYHQAVEKQKEIQKAKTRLFAVQKKLQELANLDLIKAEWEKRETIRQQKSAELQTIRQELQTLQEEQKTLQQRLEVLSSDLAQQEKTIAQLQQERDVLGQMESSTKEAQEKYQSWFAVLQKWEQTQQPQYEKAKQKQRDLEEQFAQISLEPYQNLAHELKELEETKAKLAPLEQEIERRFTQQKEFSQFQQQNDKKHREILGHQEELRQIADHKKSLFEKELGFLRRQVALSEENGQALEKLFFSYLKELLSLEENLFRLCPKSENVVESELPANWTPEQKASWAQIQQSFYQMLFFRLTLLYQKYTFLIHHPWLQTENTAIFQEYLQKKLQAIPSVKEWLNTQKRKYGEMIEVEIEFLIMTNAWANTLLEQQIQMEETRKQIEDTWKKYQSARQIFIQENPESEALFSNAVSLLYRQTQAFPELWEQVIVPSFSEDVRSLYQDFLKKWNDFQPVDYEIAQHLLLQARLNETFSQKQYLLELLQEREQSVKRSIARKEKEQRLLQEKYEVMAQEMQELPHIEEQKRLFESIIKQEPQLIQKAQTHQKLLAQQKEYQEQLEQLKQVCAVYAQEEAVYQQYSLQKENMSQLETQITQQLAMLEKLPKITNALHDESEQKILTTGRIKAIQSQLQKKVQELQEKEAQQNRVQREIPEEKTLLDQEAELKQQQEQKALLLQEQNELETRVSQENTVEEQVTKLAQQMAEFKALTQEKQVLETQLNSEPELRQRLPIYDSLPTQFKQLEHEKKQVETQLQTVLRYLEKE